MQIPELDPRTTDDIKNRIIKLSESYTPEWKADPEEPDVGMALAEIFSQMHMGTVRRLNKTAEKNRISFFNFLDTQLRSSEAATGYIHFGFSSDSNDEEVIVPKGTVLTSDMPDNAQNSWFTTMDDVCVSSSKLISMFVTDGERDVIQQIYSNENDGQKADFILFGSQSDNINKHTIYIGCNTGLIKLIGEGKIIIKFYHEKKNMSAFAEKIENAWHNSKLHICYSTNDGWEEFSSCMTNGVELSLLKSDSQPMVEKHNIDGKEAYWIKFILSDINALTDSYDGHILMASMGDGIFPDAVLTKYGTVEDTWFYPFGETPTLFDGFYIASDEALSKAGAKVSMQFTVSFSPLPEFPKTEKPVGGWKMIIRKSEVHVETPEIVQIELVSWEYFNGIGWKSLVCDGELKKAFSPIDGTRTYTLTFICPSDVHPIIVDSEERCFIRAKIVRMNQSYKLNTIYHIPLVSDILFKYSCEAFTPPSDVITENQMKRKYYNGSSIVTFFKPMKIHEPTWYLGFSSPLSKGPYRILIELERQFNEKMPELRWEYFSDNKWNPLNCYDDTGQFSHTGCITIPGITKFQHSELFHQNLYWIRVTDTSSAYNVKNRKQIRPHIIGMYMNCTEIKNFRKILPEYFSIPVAKPSFTCKLSERNICEASVWVNESQQHSYKEIEDMLHTGKAEAEYDVYGVMQRLWVRWKSVEGFFESGSEDRHYHIDRNEGSITFGDGIHGKIPFGSSGDNIRVCYSIGGGSCGNVPVGAVNGSMFALGLVTEIINPMPLYGGNDMEKAEEAMQRRAAGFQNNGCCVTARDYEEMVLRAERSIIKVKCITGYDSEGKYRSGSITILILRSDFSRESAGFYLVQEKLRKKISSRCPASLSMKKCYIIHPYYIRICVTAKVIISDSGRIFRAKECILKKISDFLHPINGNFDGNGWEIGEIPNRQQIENAIRSVSGVSYVESIIIRGFTVQGQEQTEVDMNHLTAAAFSIAISGEHDVQAESNM